MQMVYTMHFCRSEHICQNLYCYKGEMVCLFVMSVTKKLILVRFNWNFSKRWMVYLEVTHRPTAGSILFLFSFGLRQWHFINEYLKPRLREHLINAKVVKHESPWIQGHDASQYTTIDCTPGLLNNRHRKRKNTERLYRGKQCVNTIQVNRELFSNLGADKICKASSV